MYQKLTSNLFYIHIFFSDPPLEESDIPNGKWLCNTCRHAKKGESATTERSISIASAKSEIASRPETPISEIGELSHAKVKMLRNRSR